MCHVPGRPRERREEGLVDKRDLKAAMKKLRDQEEDG